MIKQQCNQSVRTTTDKNDDIRFLREYYAGKGSFPMFKQVLIETRTDCNNHCPFCPHAFFDKPLGIMKWDCYTSIIDQLYAIGYNGRIALMISNEPLLENRLKDMIVYAKKQSPRFFLDITTNGLLLNPNLLDELFTAGLDNVNINDYRGDRDKYPNKLSNNLVDVYAAYGNNPKVSFTKRCFDENLPNYAGNIPQEFNSDDYGFCNFPFRKLIVSFQGDILLCCNDFKYDTYFGNVMKDNILDCWNNPNFNRIRTELLNNNRTGLCLRCNDNQDYNAFS